MDYELYSNESDFSLALKRREDDLKRLEGEFLAALAGSPEFYRAVYKNPRLNSTSLGHRERVLKRNIVLNLDKYKSAAITANQIYLMLHADMTELKFVMEAREENKTQIDKRFKSAKLYEGSREFIESLFVDHGINTYNLSALNDEDRAVIAETIIHLLSKHLPIG